MHGKGGGEIYNGIGREINVDMKGRYKEIEWEEGRARVGEVVVCRIEYIEK